jgi:predicted negative regulator of RcsB-dependent stress response
LICGLYMSSETIRSTRGIEFLAWLEVNKGRLIAGAVVVALLASGLAIYRWRSAQQEMAATSALVQFQLRRTQADAGSGGPKAGDFLELSSKYRGTQAGQRALLLAAVALFGEGKFEESQANFEAFRSGNAGDPLAGTAALGVATCLEALGKIDEAIAAHREVITAFPETAAATQAKLALAGLLESRNELKPALEYYEQLRTTAWMNEAELRRQSLFVRHPELVPTNSVPPELEMPTFTVPPMTSD